MLHQRYRPDSLPGMLRSVSDTPYPTVDDREAWASLPTNISKSILAAADQLIDVEYGALPATLFLEFAREGNRDRYERVSFGRRTILESLLLAECLQDEGRFLDDIANGLWAICEESFWGVPAHMYLQTVGPTLADPNEHVVDLFTAETANLLAWTHRLLGSRLDSVSPMLRPRIEDEIRRRILHPLSERSDFWWMGFKRRWEGDRVNNWNPWIASNWLTCIILMESDVDARAQSIAKVMRVVDFFIDEYPSDGGCDEGPGYWGHAGASLFEVLELLHWVSSGAIDLYSEPLIRNIGSYIYRAHIADDYYLNFADAPARTHPDAAIVHAFGTAIGDASMQAFGRWLHAGDGTARFDGRDPRTKRQTNYVRRPLRSLFGSLAAETLAPAASAVLPRDVYLDQIQVMVARDVGGSSEGWFLGAKGGHNRESHNHNDVGNSVVYRDGRPLLVDAGVETYTAKTFSDRRYEIWTMQSSFHSLLPEVDGVQQRMGREYAARDLSYHADETRASFELEISGAYPPEVGIRQWNRSIVLDRGRGVTIRDRYELERSASRVRLSILTPGSVNLAPGRIDIGEVEFLPGSPSGHGSMTFDADLFVAVAEEIPITDDRLGATWGTRLTRVVLTCESAPQTGELLFEVHE